MCRLFGFHSNVYLKVHKSLTQAENALATQSKKHPHGWGIGYYDNNLPIITKSPKPAFEDKSFDNASNFVTAQTVVAHIRKATVGKINVTNTHPFKYKEWVFAHNGHLEGFDQIKQQVLSSIHPKYRERIEGDTDSEHIFYLLLSEIKNSNLELKTISVSELAQALGRVILYFEQLDKFHSLGGVLTNILLTNGKTFLFCKNGKDLFFSTQKNFCSDIDVCTSVNKECLLGVRHHAINHIIVSSEKITNEDVWEQVENRTISVVDQSMYMKVFELDKIQGSLSFSL